ncbi:MAG: MFS transporter [Burkholderiaceae bacterium]|nr:MFS transporter [Burkholderiaceae bacterium]
MQRRSPSGAVRARAGLSFSSRVLGALLLSNSYALALFSRTAGTVLVVALAATFHTGVAEVSLVATVFFWVYALLQVPAGMLADVLGSRRLAVLGALVTGVGSSWFAAAGSVGEAVAARAAVAVGCSVVFVSMMRYVRIHWPQRRVATVSGRCILVGNIGAIASAGPLSYLLMYCDWRTVSAALGLLSFSIAAVLWFVMAEAPRTPHRHVRLDAILKELRTVAANRCNQVGLLMMAGLAGSYYGLASLWIVPLLGARGAGAGTLALQASLLIGGFACGACALGWLGDRSSRRLTLSVACVGAALCWTLLARAAVPTGVGSAALLFALGFCSGSFNLIYALVSERNPVEHAGTATAFINVGIFLGAGSVQSISSALYVATQGNFAIVLEPMIAGASMATLLSLSLFRRRVAHDAAARIHPAPVSGWDRR